MRTRTFWLAISFIFILYGLASAQSSANTSAGIRIKLIKSLNINAEQGNLDFGEIILPAQNKMLLKTPDKGLQLTVKGQPDKLVMFTFRKTRLNLLRENNRSNDALQFQPLVVRTNNNTKFLNPTPIINGQSYKLQNQKGEGRIYIWVGGKLELTENQSPGDYEGTFTLSVVY
ncbi:hypothetical protein BMS3Abin04_01081 [bacterium BMS3Abin04]|nr:hypothetical protein BMS3Abin04_01081 [bacterium BMS3Abin04]